MVIALDFIKKREKICMGCDKKLHFWQRKWRLIKGDCCVWHYKCKDVTTVPEENKMDKEEKTWTESEVNKAIELAIEPYEKVLKLLKTVLGLLALAAVLTVITVYLNR